MLRAFYSYSNGKVFLDLSNPEKGRETLRRYNATDAVKASKRDWKRKRDRTIVDKRQWFIDTYGDPVHGLDGDPPLTQDGIAALMECSRQRISQLKKKAEEKLAPLKKAHRS